MGVHFLKPKDLNPETIRLPEATSKKLNTIAIAVAALGLVLTGIGYVQNPQGVPYAYLTGFIFWLTVALGGLFFVLIQHLTRAGWSVVVRRAAETLSATMPLFLLLFVPVLLWAHTLYPGTHEGHLEGSKATWMSLGWVAPRAIIYMVIWTLMANKLRSLSVQQDTTGDLALTEKAQTLSPGFTFVFAISISLAAIDWIMALNPHWYSTMWGVYFFAGCALAVFATLALIAIGFQKLPSMQGVIREDHLHDIGKFLFAFTVFWAYIAFCQFMLIWYSNIPEETEFFLHRFHGDNWYSGWQFVSWALLFGQFIIPFFILLSRNVKRKPLLLAVGAVWQLAFHFVDLVWQIVPHRETAGTVTGAHETTAEVAHHASILGIGDFGPVLLIGGIWALFFLRQLKSHALVPLKDPRLAESLAIEVA